MIESKYLKANVQNIQKLMIIEPLRKFETAQLKNLLKLSKVREYTRNEPIIVEGARDRWIYFLLGGSVRVEKDGVVLHVINEMGELFGELSLIDGQTRSASIYAESKTICLAIDLAAEDRLTSDDRADLLLLLYRIFAEYVSMRLRITSAELVKARREVELLKRRLND